MPSCYTCGAQITFGDYVVSAKSGKKIPLDLNENKYQCPNNRRYSPGRNQWGTDI
jgi:hypothetical protein